MSNKKERKNPFHSSNRFSSLAPDLDSKSKSKKKSKEKSTEKPKENSRFKNLETKKNIFSKPEPRENSRWRRESDDKDRDSRKIPHNNYHNEKKYDKDSKFWSGKRSRDRKTNYRKRDKSDRLQSQSGYSRRINNFSRRPPAFNVEKENFPSLFTDKQESCKKEDDIVDEKPTSIISSRLDYYRYLLGVTKESTKDEIQKAYNDILSKFKQDDKLTTEQNDQIEKINNAYNTLLKPTNFKSVIKNKKKKFKRVPTYSVKPGWVKLKLRKGVIEKTEGPPIKRIPKQQNVTEIQKRIMHEMNERHRFYRELDGITMSDIFREDELLSDDENMCGYNSGSDNDSFNTRDDYDAY